VTNTDFCSVTLTGTHNYHWALEGSVYTPKPLWKNLCDVMGISVSEWIACSYYALVLLNFVRKKNLKRLKGTKTWIDYILITNLMHWLLFIHKVLFSSTYFEPQVLIFRRIQLYICSIWYCHSLWEFVMACRYTAWVSSQSSCVPIGYQELSYRVTVLYAACVQLYPPEDKHLRLETCRGE